LYVLARCHSKTLGITVNHPDLQTERYASYVGPSPVHLRLNPKKIDTKGFSTESVTIFYAF